MAESRSWRQRWATVAGGPFSRPAADSDREGIAITNSHDQSSSRSPLPNSCSTQGGFVGP
jgi:hypothetical protein